MAEQPMTKAQIRELRRLTGLSQPAFAKRLGLSERCHSTVSRWESENMPTMPDQRSLHALWALWAQSHADTTLSEAHVAWLRA